MVHIPQVETLDVMNVRIQVTLCVTVREGSVFHRQGDLPILLGGRLPKSSSMTDPIAWIGTIERIKGTKTVQIPDPGNLGEWRGKTIHQMSRPEDLQDQIIKMLEVHHHQKIWRVGNNKSILRL